MSERVIPAPNDSVIKAAAYWVLRLNDEDCSAADRLAFQDWVQAIPEHAFEYAKMLEIWEQSEQLPAAIPGLR